MDQCDWNSVPIPDQKSYKVRNIFISIRIVNWFAIIKNRLEELHLVNVSGIYIKDWNNVLIHLSHMSHCKYVNIE